MSQHGKERILSAGIPAEVANMASALASCGMQAHTPEAGAELVEAVRQHAVSSLILRLASKDADLAYLATAAMAKAWILDGGSAIFRRMQDALRTYERYQNQDRGDYGDDDRALLFPRDGTVLFIPDLMDWPGWEHCTRVQQEDALGMLHRYVARGSAVCFPHATASSEPKAVKASQVYGAIMRRSRTIHVQPKGTK